NEITVTGKVRSDSADLTGVSVSLKTDPKKVTATNSAGVYTIKVPANGILVFTHVGYEKQEVEISGRSVVNITLKAADNKLGDVVVVGYGTQRKSTLVGSVESISPKDLKGPTSNMTTMLAGRISGMISFQT